MTEEWAIEDCDGCHSKEVVGGLERYDFRPAGSKPPNWNREFMMLCAICAGSYIGIMTRHKSQYLTQEPVLTTVGFIGNMLRRDIQALKPVRRRFRPQDLHGNLKSLYSRMLAKRVNTK